MVASKAVSESNLHREARQRRLPLPPPTFEEAPDLEHGAVFTLRWVVDHILDWVGYDPHLDLAAHRLVEPSCGDGAFLAAVAQRVIHSCEAQGRPLLEARDAVRAYDVQARHVRASRRVIRDAFEAAGLDGDSATGLAACWVRHGDFLLTEHREGSADFVVGNPPYIRLEDVPRDRRNAYQQVCSTMTGRADIYVGFYELGLRLLRDQGTLGFICADRWMRNAYGRRLRGMVARGYSVEAVLELHDVEVFAEEVSAYPAITILRRQKQSSPIVATTTSEFTEKTASTLQVWARSNPPPGTVLELEGAGQAARLPGWFETDASWPAGSPARLQLLEEMEERFPPLEIDSTQVGIGVATGADAVFITANPEVAEPDRLIPLAMSRDITSGELCWEGRYLVNPWAGPGQLVRLEDYPRLARYLEEHAPRLRNRYVARKRPGRWYRTIDPVHPELVERPKLLIPDMKNFSHPVLDTGGHYPHHNLYYVVSDDWDLKVLGGLLMSRVAQFFIELYAVRMRGGTLRFQAQYLRRIRLPEPDSLDPGLTAELRGAFERRDVDAATEMALVAFGVDELPD